jgi:type IV pilus assembly protein PilE
MTMVELVIVLALIAILAAIGYPLYAEQVAKSRRADAQGALLAFAQAMERHAAANPNTGYAGAAAGGADTGTPDPAVFPDEAPLNSTEKYYDLNIQAVTMDGAYGRAYVIEAIPKGKQAADECDSFRLSSAGVRTVTGSGTCWR